MGYQVTDQNRAARVLLRFADQVDEALELSGDPHGLHHVLLEILMDRAQLWDNDGGMIVTTVCDDSTGTTVSFWIAAGDLDSVLELSDEVCEWARSIGAIQVVMTGRRGWERVLASRGWEANRQLVSYGKAL